MAKKRPLVQEVSYGLYEPFESEGKALPVLSGDGAFTARVPAVVGQEFGYILKVKHGRGMRLAFEIDHPGIPDADGVVREPFRGEVFVRNSDFDFFLGDALWEPLEHMLGEWTLTCRLADKVVAKRTFEVVPQANLEGDPDGWDWDALPMQ
ncbi:MAG: DUF3859 domain-containing protein [Planctomycetota bacterium]